MEPARHGNHGGIVRRKLELRQVGVPAALAAFRLYARAQAAVRGHAAADRHLLDPGLLRRLDQFVQQDVDQRLLERCAEVLLVLLQEVRIFRHLVPDEIEQRSLHAAETVIQSFNVRLRELEARRISLLCKPVDNRTAGITQAQHLGTFVERLPHRVVDGLSEDLEMQGVVHPHDLGVAAADQQAEVREGGLPDRLAFLPDECGQQMSLKMVYHDQRDLKRQPHRLRERRSDQQGTQQSGAAGESNGSQFGWLYARTGKRFADHRDDVELVRTGRQFRHHTAERAVHVLAGDDVGEQYTVADDGRRGVVAGGFNAKDNICHQRRTFLQR